MKHYDAVIIGFGKGGKTLAGSLVSLQSRWLTALRLQSFKNQAAMMKRTAYTGKRWRKSAG